MKKLLLALALMVGLYSCKKEEPAMTRAEIIQKADSITQIRVRESNDHAKTDLEIRLKTDVRGIVDSLLREKAKQRIGDTVKPVSNMRPMGMMGSMAPGVMGQVK